MKNPQDMVVKSNTLIEASYLWKLNILRSEILGDRFEKLDLNKGENYKLSGGSVDRVWSLGRMIRFVDLIICGTLLDC